MPNALMRRRLSALALPFAMLWQMACTGATAAPPAAPDLAGAWARRAADCGSPELEFGADRLTVRLSADGTPAGFEYPGVSYRREGARITAVLGQRHPYSKTASGTELEFTLGSNAAQLELQRRPPAGPIRFVRCR